MGSSNWIVFFFYILCPLVGPSLLLELLKLEGAAVFVGSLIELLFQFNHVNFIVILPK